MTNNTKKGVRLSPVIYGIALGSAIFCAGILLSFFLYGSSVRTLEKETDRVLNVVEQNIQSVLTESYGVSLLLASIVQEDGSVQDFEETSRNLLTQFSAADILEIAPEGVIDYVYPLEGNEAVLGFNILEDSSVNQEVLRAAESRSIFFAGPLELVQGQEAVVGRFPIFIDGNLWGFSAVITYLDTFIEFSGMESFSDRYYFQIAKNNPFSGEVQYFLPIDESIELDSFMSIDFPEGDWRIYATSLDTSSRATGVFLIIILFAIGGIITGVLLFKTLMKPFELEELLDKKSEQLLKSREEFKQNSELLSSVLESPETIIIFSIDKDYKYLAFNKKYVETFTLSSTDTIKKGKSVFDFRPEYLHKKLKANYDRALNGESFESIQEVYQKDNEPSFWQTWYSPIRNKNRDIIGLTIFSMDVTQRLKFEERIAQSERRYRTLISSSPYCIHELDREGKLISINETGLKMFNKEREEEVLGQSYAELVGEHNIQKVNEAVFEALNDHSNEIEFSAGGGHYLSSFIPLKNDQGDIFKLMGITQDITERKESEDFVEKSLKEKTMLLEEIHHRVKNNLAIVSGLLQLQKSEVQDDYLTAVFDQSINRIISIAMVHELMYSSEDLSSVNVHSYLQRLIPAISATMQNASDNVHFDIDIDEYKLNINQAIPLGLLLNELITNSFKYAFNGHSDNKISVHLVSIKDTILVHYSDNGNGFKPEIDFTKPKNLGLNLIHAQLNQLDAKYRVETNNQFQLNFTFTVQGKGSHSNIYN